MFRNTAKLKALQIDVGFLKSELAHEREARHRLEELVARLMEHLKLEVVRQPSLKIQAISPMTRSINDA